MPNRIIYIVLMLFVAVHIEAAVDGNEEEYEEEYEELSNSQQLQVSFDRPSMTDVNQSDFSDFTEYVLFDEKNGKITQHAHEIQLFKPSISVVKNTDSYEENFSAGESYAENIEYESQNTSNVHVVGIIASSLLLTSGVVMTYLYDKKAKDKYENSEPMSEDDYKSDRKSINDYQTYRTVGIIMAGVGGIGLVVSIAF